MGVVAQKHFEEECGFHSKCFMWGLEAMRDIKVA